MERNRDYFWQSRPQRLNRSHAWRHRAAIVLGPLFRRVSAHDTVLAPRRVTCRGRPLDEGLSAQPVALIVNASAERTGVDPADYAGHSLRRGFSTSAANAGATVWKLLEITRHASVAGVQPYIQAAERFNDHAGEGLLD